jgi:hypothetical protein
MILPNRILFHAQPSFFAGMKSNVEPSGLPRDFTSTTRQRVSWMGEQDSLAGASCLYCAACFERSKPARSLCRCDLHRRPHRHTGSGQIA